MTSYLLLPQCPISRLFLRTFPRGSNGMIYATELNANRLLYEMLGSGLLFIRK